MLKNSHKLETSGWLVFDQSYGGSQSLFVIGDKNKHFHDDCALTTDVLIAASCGEAAGSK